MIADTAAELAGLWPALAAALERDTVTETGSTHAWAAAVVVNADVLAAMLTIGQEIPQAARLACEAVGEPWQHRDLGACLVALPRLADRLRALGMVAGERHLCAQCAGWLRLVKRALGLREPDLRLCECPYVAEQPADHAHASRLFRAGREGFLRSSPDGLYVEWQEKAVIYCASEECGASWAKWQWPFLKRLLERRAADLARAG